MSIRYDIHARRGQVTVILLVDGFPGIYVGIAGGGQVTGNQFYDTVGTGATAAIKFATLGTTTPTAMAFADFLFG
jgi:hypothetical protein